MTTDLRGGDGSTVPVTGLVGTGPFVVIRVIRMLLILMAIGMLLTVTAEG